MCKMLLPQIRVFCKSQKQKFKRALLAACVLNVRQAEATTGFWKYTDGTPALWSGTTNWWTTAAGTTNVGAVPGSSDNAFFTGGIASPYTTSTGSYNFFPQLGANVAVAGFQFNTGSSGGVPSDSTLLLASSSATVRTLTFGASGFSVNNGVLTLADSINLTNNAGNIGVANTQDSRALLIMGTGTISMSGSQFFRVGNAANTSGGVSLKTGSTINITAATENRVFIFGASDGSYGALTMAGGTITSPRLTLGGDGQTAGNGGLGVATINGGTLNTSDYIILNRTGTTGGGLLTINGGTINHSGSNGIYLGFTNAGKTELNLLGGALNNNSNLINFGNAANYSGNGVANINAGTLSTRGFAIGTTGSYQLNFNGGVVKAAAGGVGTFLPAAATAQTYVNGAFGTYAGGAVVDTNGQNIAIAANLLSPTGNGVATIPVASSGSGYVGAPQVVITGGGGTGATAVANMVDDGTGKGTYKINSITVTNPGVNYTGTPTVSLNMGGYLTAATLGTVTTGTNISGGLTKQGAGTLTLSGANTYTGTTSVTGGTLLLSGSNRLAAASPISVNGGTLDLGGGTQTTAAAISVISGNVTNGTLSKSGTDYDVQAGTVSALLSGNAGLTKLTTGTVTLANANYSGNTTVNAGTLIVTGTLANNGPANVFIAAPDYSSSDNPMLTRAIGAGTNKLAGYGSTVTAASLDTVLTPNAGLQTKAEILMSGVTAGGDLSMQWRLREANEALPSNPNAVLSDVLNLDTGLGNEVFVLSMSYNTAALTNLNLNEMAIATSGELRLGWNNGSAWVTAVDGNDYTGGGSSAFVGLGSWSDYYSAHGGNGTGSDLASFLGKYGVDQATGRVWAVVNHNSEFAVIPEPSTLVIGGIALLGLGVGGMRRRRSKVKANS